MLKNEQFIFNGRITGILYLLLLLCTSIFEYAATVSSPTLGSLFEFFLFRSNF